MKELVFALEFKGSGIQAAVESTGAGSASFESEVEIVGGGMFVESGRIRYGEVGTHGEVVDDQFARIFVPSSA